MKRSVRAYAVAAGVCALAAASTGCGEEVGPTATATETATATYASMGAAYQAVDTVAGCDDDEPEPPDYFRTAEFLDGGGSVAEIRMCTRSAGVFWFETSEDRAAVYDLVAGTGGSDELVHYAQGYNWFLADLSATRLGIPGRVLDVEHVADQLDASYSEAAIYATVTMDEPKSLPPLPGGIPRGTAFFDEVRRSAPTLTPERIDDQGLLTTGYVACIDPERAPTPEQALESLVERGFTEAEAEVIFTAGGKYLC